jgi:hypothetical protein
MRFLRPALGFVAALAFFGGAPRLAHADDPEQGPPAADPHWHEPDEHATRPQPAPTGAPSDVRQRRQAVFVHLDAGTTVIITLWPGDASR